MYVPGVHLTGTFEAAHCNASLLLAPLTLHDPPLPSLLISTGHVCCCLKVGISRYSDVKGFGSAGLSELGVPAGIRMENGTLLDLEKPIHEQLPDDEHVWVLLRGD